MTSSRGLLDVRRAERDFGFRAKIDHREVQKARW
jgi:hypothetical protein